MKMNPENFKLISKKCTYKWKDRWSIIEADIRTANENIVTWAYIQDVDYVVAVPIRKDGKIIMKREYRVSRDEVVLELPSGRVNTKKNTSLIEEANRELQEEIGFKANKFKKLISFYPWNHSSFKIHIYLVFDLIKSKLKPDQNEIIDVVVLPLKNALSECFEGKSNAQTLIGLLLTKEYLEKKSI